MRSTPFSSKHKPCTCSHCVFPSQTHICAHVVPIPADSFGVEARCAAEVAVLHDLHTMRQGCLAVTPSAPHSSPQIWDFKALWQKSAAGFLSSSKVQLGGEMVAPGPCLRGQTSLLISPGLLQATCFPGGYSALDWDCHQNPLLQHGSDVGVFGGVQTGSLPAFLLRN